MKKQVLPIITHPSESLRRRSIELSKKEILSDEVQSLIKPMIDTMYDDDGIGLAAPQIGKNIRLIVIGKEAAKELDFDMVLINPTWQKISKKTNWEVEGCLSVPNIYGKVRRFTSIDVQALDQQGNKILFEAYGFLSRVIQHEVDHLDGILFIDKAKDTHKLDPLTQKKHPL